MCDMTDATDGVQGSPTTANQSAGPITWGWPG